jgi:hypothetical protein
VGANYEGWGQFFAKEEGWMDERAVNGLLWLSEEEHDKRLESLKVICAGAEGRK